MNKHDYFEIPVIEVIQQTDDSVSIAFDIPAELSDLFKYRPGQFVTLRISSEGKFRHRCYSLCSAPGIDALPAIAVKRVEGGLISNHICSTVKPGQTLLVQPPAGQFVLPDNIDGNFVLAAGGSGITPILSILKFILASNKGRILLIYANRDEKSVIFSKEIRELLTAHPDRLTVCHWLESMQGLPSARHLAELMRGWSEAQLFICGPAPFMTATTQAGKSVGIAHGDIHTEKFVSLPDEDGNVVPIDVLGGNSTPTALIVSIDGEERAIDWQPGQKLLDTMLEAGLDAPYSCRVGGCSACMCRVVEGKVATSNNLILTDEEVAEGWVLACQAIAVSAKVHVEIP